MRITRDLLHKFARETVRKRKRSEPDLHAAYLVGSLLDDEPLLGGTTDIDIILVHKYQVPVPRECVSLTPEISLDIFHKITDDFDQPRALREDPWMGYPLTKNHILLYDTDHWLEFIQASVSAEFHRPDYVLTRVQTLLNTARENWFSMIDTPSKTHLAWLNLYFINLSLAANALSGLIGPPLTRRRFMLTFDHRTEQLAIDQMLVGFKGLMGFRDSHADSLTDWTSGLSEDLLYLAEKTEAPIHLSNPRHAYYLDAIKALVESGTPSHASWPLLRTWLDIRLAIPLPAPGDDAWHDCLESLGLTEEATEEKTEALDAYLDQVDILIENWAEAYGV